MLHIYIDADACPVKEETYRVARRSGLHVTLVANSWMRVPDAPTVALQVVPGGFDVADDWIAEHAGEDDVVITADIELADRCLKAGAHVIGTTGKEFTENNIGSALATRDLLSDLRGMGEMGGGPAPMRRQDRSRFLQQLDEVVQRVRRRRR
jgi:uncharacterized protein YaiI (UPF0178 family)